MFPDFLDYIILFTIFIFWTYLTFYDKIWKLMFINVVLLCSICQYFCSCDDPRRPDSVGWWRCRNVNSPTLPPYKSSNHYFSSFLFLILELGVFCLTMMAYQGHGVCLTRKCLLFAPTTGISTYDKPYIIDKESVRTSNQMSMNPGHI
jgi:hypothetical protein